MLLPLSLLSLLLSAPAPVTAQEAQAQAQAPLQFELPNLQTSIAISANITNPYFAVQQQELKPTCIIHPESAEPLSRIVLPDGLLIDLSWLNTVTISEDESIASIGTVCRWMDVYPVLEERGFLVVGGRADTVGVGYRSYLADTGGPSTTSATTNSFPDLYWSLRGGGNNFGIVTRFDFEAHRHEQISGGTNVFLLDDLESRIPSLYLQNPWEWSLHSIISRTSRLLASTLVKFGRSVHSREFINEFVKLADEKQTDTGAHAGPDENPEVSADLSKMPKLYSTQRVAKMSEFTREIDGQNEMLRGRRNTRRTMTLKVDAELISDILDVFLEHTHPFTKIPGVLLSTNLQLLTKHEIGLFGRNGGNALGIHPDDGPLFCITTFSHEDPAADEKLATVAEDIMAQVTAIAKERGLFHPFIYQNYAGAGQDVYAGYGADNRAILAEIQKKYDPEGVFWKLQPGYYKV
ncbi:hypothetical protein BJX70DRAFT_407513 [Aspergillus crustosus]